MERRRPDIHYTTADYDQWEGDWELWDGVPVAMSPSPFERHGELAGELIYRIKQQLREQKNCNCRVLVEIDWRVTLDTVVRPDISVLCDREPRDGHINRPPTLIAEVLSPATEKKDRTAKFDLYAEQGVPHYLMVAQDTGAVEALTLTDGTYAASVPDEAGFALELHDGCRLVLPAVLEV